MEKLTVCITTYNLEKYIKEALDNILKQKVNFDYKIIIADDCSTDNTRNILIDYQEKYPNKIELILNEKNLGSLGNSNQIFSNIKTEYFTFLDGDDYWIDSNMLQKSVDFLDNNPNYSMVGGNTYYLRDSKLADSVVQKKQTNRSYTFDDYINGSIPFVHTSALVLRNIIFNNGLPNCFSDAVDTFENCALRGEDFRRLLHLQQGSLFVMDEHFSVYRIHSEGMWQGASSLKRSIEAAISFNFYAKYFGDGYNGFFVNNKERSYKSLLNTLIANYKFNCGNYLSKKESDLLSAYLTDIRTDKAIKQNKFISFTKKAILHFLFK